MIKSLLKKIFSTNIINCLVKLRQKVDLSLIYVMSKTRFTSSVYYAFFSHQFSREHQAVLRGRLAYQESLVNVGQSSVLLRRNIHRIEKGLIMQPRKQVFAQDYIGETVDVFQKCSEHSSFSSEELHWAHQVLSRYFSSVTSTEIVNKAYQQFLTCHRTDVSTALAAPYESEQRVTSNISPEQLHDLFKQRRSTRWFEPKQVPDNLIEQAVVMAAQAPSACNRQPFQFYKVSESNKATEIAACAMGTQGFAENIQALMVVVGDLSSYPKEQDRHVIYIDGGLVAMQFMLAAETLGLATCPINWPDIEPYEKKLAEKLSLPIYLRPIMMIAIGYPTPKGGVPYSQKKSAQLLIKEI